MFSGEKERCDEMITSLKIKILEAKEDEEGKSDQSSNIRRIDETLEIQVSESLPNSISALEPNQILESTLDPNCVENDETFNLGKNSKTQASENEASQVFESTRNESKERMSLSMTSNISPITMKPMNQSEIQELIKKPNEKIFDFSEDLFDGNSKQDSTSKVTSSKSKQDDSRVTGSSCSGIDNALLQDLYEEIEKEKDPDFIPSDLEKNAGKLFIIILAVSSSNV